jgi:hypothetical protein
MLLPADDDAAERYRLTEALFQGRICDERTLWEVTQLLHLPQRGPYAAVAAACTTVGAQPLPRIANVLRSLDVFSTWHQLPDLQIGVVHVPSPAKDTALISALRRIAPSRVGISPHFDHLAETSEAVRYARAAMASGNSTDSRVTVFDDSPLAIAAVSAPEMSRKLTQVVLRDFQCLPQDERDVLSHTFHTWVDSGGSVNPTAKELHCHPNTVRYRLRRIEERTERSLSSPKDLAELCLAFQGYGRGS